MDTVMIGVFSVFLVFIVGIVTLVVWTVRRGSGVIDVRQTYFYLVALTTLLSGFIGVLVLVGILFALFLTYTADDLPMARKQIANILGLLLIIVPVWWFHWQHARQGALRMQRYFGLRVYLYTIMVIGLMFGVSFAGIAGAEIVKALLFGLVDFSNAESVRSFWRNELSAIVSVFVAFAVWYYHWHTVERVPTTDH